MQLCPPSGKKRAAAIVLAATTLVTAIGTLAPAGAHAAPRSGAARQTAALSDLRCKSISPADRPRCNWLARASALQCSALQPAAKRVNCFTKRGKARYRFRQTLSRAGYKGRGQRPLPLRRATPPRTPADIATDIALHYRGTPYRWGGTSPGGFDCSGLVQYAYRHAGRALPRTTWDQFHAGRRVGHARRGDLVFVYGKNHVGIALGDGKYVNAPRAGKPVQVQPIPGHVDGIVRVA